MAVPYTLGLHQIAADTYTYLQPSGTWGFSNAGLVVSGDEGLLVDTLFTVPQTHAMLDEMTRALPRLTINTLVNSHSDGDHWWGNQLLPDAAILASEAAAAAMRRDRLHELFASPGTVPLPRVAEDMRETFDFTGITPTLPTRAFSGELEVTVGRRTVRLIEVGPAHTTGDVLVHVPDAAVLFAGDILFIGGHPVIHSGPVENWIAACDLILGLDVETIVPGHGPVVGKPEVRAFRHYLERVRDHAVRAHQAGVPVLQAAREMDLDGFPNWDDPERLVLNIGAVYRELNGDGTPAEEELMGHLDEYAAPRPAETPPRIAPRPASEIAALAPRLEGPAAQILAGGAGPLVGRPVLNVLATIGNHPDLLVALAPLLTQLAQGLIPPRQRELAILRTAHRTGSAYEWEHHVHIGAAAGLTESEIARALAGPDDPGWDEADRALLRAVDELHEQHMVSPATWQELTTHHSPPQLLELLALTGTYALIAGILNTCQVPLDDWLAQPAQA
ncbi:Hydroxyacylglutathione hydrolase [Streptomyces sp. YIM 121038]|uniref:MBL fold metallo-hydrolase n=1 Tax=Streptomyces sp. YIM 121038 TaxID=2136401 RepID=UPI0011101A1C|nr:MBL fold metallo-hydrolase [Streptomyces sp. YIM 121038]QCX74664.1 Hydroxyacylglutathione hydrolase [Streptomyces sp. YIM 121038]